MPAITTGFSLRLPSCIFSSAPHLCIQWSSSLHLARKPDGFEAPVFIPWKDKIAYKFIVDGRWMTNDTEPTEIDHGFVNNVYTAPPKPALPEPEQANDPPSYHIGSEAEPEHAEKVPEHADKPPMNGSAIDEHHEAPEPTVDSTSEQANTVDEEVKVAVAVVELVEDAAPQVAPGPQEVEEATDEVCVDPSTFKLDSILTIVIQLSEPQVPEVLVLSASVVGFIPNLPHRLHNLTLCSPSRPWTPLSSPLPPLRRKSTLSTSVRRTCPCVLLHVFLLPRWFLKPRVRLQRLPHLPLKLRHKQWRM
jgi:Glycogen recognition site of AMP-activated protein kinase